MNRGRGRALVTGGLLGLICLAGTGCQISIGIPKNNISQEKQKHSAPPVVYPGGNQEVQDLAPQPTPGSKGHLKPVPGPSVPVESHPIGDPGCPGSGCAPGGVVHHAPPRETCAPTELQKVIHPPYMIEPPDILFIDAARLVPRAPYRLQPLDVLIIQSSESLPQEPILGQFTIGPEGYVSLGFSYGSVRIVGLTLRQAQRQLQEHIASRVRGAEVSVALAQFRGVQQTTGEHLVRPDGTISLGTYGCVNVTGLTLSQAKYAIEQHLSQFLQDPEVSVDVFSYNSKAYYVILDGGGFGQQVFKFPSTGNETVLDAIEQIGGLPSVSSMKRIWVARPAPAGHKCVQILPVNWKAIVKGGATDTNYQLFPGDRIYVDADAFIKADNWLAKIIAPIERLFGITLLGVSTVRSFQNNGAGGNIGFIGGF